MGNSFLEEQLERMRRLTERMAQVRSELIIGSEVVSRERELHHDGPLGEIRDYRTHQTHDYASRAEDRPARRRASRKKR